MSNQYASLNSLKTLISSSLLISALLFDGGANFMGFVFNGEDFHRGIQAANKDHTSLRLLKEVVPGADSFSEKEGQPAIRRAYQTDPDTGEQTLIGYAVVTADVPPEPNGFSGPIDTLIGLDLDGVIVGLRVIYYKESLRQTWGDFLEFPGVQEQYIGMRAADKFRVGRGREIDGIARATISAKAMARGIRQAVRAVTQVYIDK